MRTVVGSSCTAGAPQEQGGSGHFIDWVVQLPLPGILRGGSRARYGAAVLVVVLLDVRLNRPRPFGAGQHPRHLLVLVKRQADLAEVVAAARLVGGLAHCLHHGQQQADQHADDGRDHQQLK